MNHENNEVSALLIAAKELAHKDALNSSEKLLARIILRTMMTVATPDMLSDDELDTMNTIVMKAGMFPEDVIRMAASIMAENLMKKLDGNISKLA